MTTQWSRGKKDRLCLESAPFSEHFFVLAEQLQQLFYFDVKLALLDAAETK